MRAPDVKEGILGVRVALISCFAFINAAEEQKC